MINYLRSPYFLIKRTLFLRVHLLKTLAFIPVFVFTAFSVVAQDDQPVKRKGSRIIDDTTKQVYGATTSRYFYEEDVFYNKEISHPIDTAIRNYHRFNFVQRYNNRYQDLGNIGTAIRPIFFTLPTLIGATSGFESFSLYWNAEPMKYYDTKSPYSNMTIILGGRGRSMTDVSFSRNINPRWNFGFDYRTILSDKQIQRAGKGDRNVKSTYYDIYTAYQSKDSTYRLFVNFKRHKYLAFENGGITADESGNTLERYFYDNAQPRLTKAQNRERRINFHVYQQYKLVGKGFQLYHVLDVDRQHNNFYDFNNQEPSDYFDYVNTFLYKGKEVNKDTIKDENRFRSIRNEVGIKGNISKLFYNGYYATRRASMDYKYLTNADVKIPLGTTEHYIGGRIALLLDSIGDVKGLVEVDPVSNNFKIEGSIQSRWFEASLKQVQYAPGFLYQAYKGGHDQWNNNFDAVKATQINGYLHYNSRILSLSPGLTFTRLNDYVYFKKGDFGEPQTVLPAQSRETQVVASPELKISLTILRHINFSVQGIYSSVLLNGDDVVSLPTLFVNTQLAYSNIFFHGNMDMHGGVDVHWKSDYYAMGYDPVIQQFYRQNEFKSPAFPIVDVFFSMKVKSGRMFLKYNNLLQAFTKSGYFPTPYYVGQRNVIDFGFNLFFYD